MNTIRIINDHLATITIKPNVAVNLLYFWHTQPCAYTHLLQLTID